MKVAIVCLAYLGSRSGIDLLSRYFLRMDAHLFVHVDAKKPLDPYVNNAPNVTLLPTRREIFWGGFNTVETAVSSIEFAQKEGPFDRFVFTTEDSIPLVCPSELEDRFASDVDWIAINYPSPPWVWQRYPDFFYFDSRATSLKYFEAEDRFITEKDLGCLKRMRLLRRKGKTKLPELYHGCGWWALTGSTVDTILERHYSDKRLRESFEFSMIPEEQYFHTIIGLSKVNRPRESFMYVDWDRDEYVKPYVFGRYEELKEIQRDNPELLFVRKTNLESGEVADFVEELLQG
jgi:hypothetical protein